ncbi:prefoldin, alpha subunit [Candidozyma duobushaemuli]|uniref:Prefoldin, alpha subunit n=1 Tax=Candidozyma duobushaemuli TaxID=1231522 RepID=A0A2V1A872_9ASCO|nr:prefoldin, alpha subunit [[Candida] duobushaemulonis]PVH13463.1 prefoldin, alpha subunit [[Candida] duobushaemulonis]
MSKLPLSVRVTDTVHRVFVMGLFGITAVGTGSILFNIYANSDFGGMNKNKLKFNREEFDESRSQATDDKQGAKIAAQISNEELLNSSTQPHYIPPMSQRKIDISQLEPQQILEIRKSTEQEIQHFTQSLQALQTAQSKLQDCVNTIDNMGASEGGDLLVPMTASLYLPGKVAQKDRFMVDIGTGYFVEKDADSARKVYKKKLTKLGEDSKKLKEILVQKNEIMNNLTLVLRKKAMDQQQAAQS